jgi:hypothetical protein
MRKQQNNLRNVAADTSNISELYRALGKLTKAQQFGEQSVIYADRSETKYTCIWPS